ncbi:MAG: ATP-dependent Clp protease ATP-binding subunit [Planctomycetes bacterium]|jgi:energy-coupling factor transporter ATP-binding protein EcfA2|nr:ATP-dependent Clp protease ATP-binding subunit [Planctomycetota bacterium]HON44744.1 AAA family ATPase [Planctomycetota bacterium]HPY75941.1 AAA family ATPase [Planctomycetota bacterium]HQB00167.1 AAA family ATPase [Planctomycetota bacterium]HRU51371.1 AAA family ATPase [Planctomycetota bacterium]
MALENAFNRLKREIGIKRCIIIDGNVGDVYINEKGQIINLSNQLKQILQSMNYDNIICWDKVDGTKDDISSLDLVESVEVEGDSYLDDGELNELVATPSKDQKNQEEFNTSDINEMLNVVMKNLLNKNKKVAFIINWADYIFSAQQLPPDEREQLTILGKAIREKMPDHTSTDVNESLILLITNKLSMFPIAFYQANPEVSTITLPKPDRREREAMLRKISYTFNVTTEKGKELMESEKINEYIDMLHDFTNREIIQLARLSRKEEKMTFDKLYLLFKYGEKDNPWEKLANSEVKKIKQKLSERVIGQEEAIKKIEKVVVKAYMGMTGIHKTSSRSMPKGVLFFVGPTGVGKTELSKALAKFLFGDEDACIRFDMSEYAQENSDQKLIGAPPGYIGYEEGGQLTNAIREKPFSVILFDEIEKAAKPNPRILDIFLQILEDGRLTDSKGETVYFSESVIIFTSNLGASEVDADSKNPAEEFIRIVKNYFDKELKRPELLGRIGYSNIVPFNFIRDEESRKKIAQSKLKPIQNGIKEKYHMTLTFDNESDFIEYVLKDADKSKGGRDILNALNDNLLDDLAMFLFKNKEDLGVLRGSNICVSTKKDEISFRFE